jgi:hypothetical protein
MNPFFSPFKQLLSDSFKIRFKFLFRYAMDFSMTFDRLIQMGDIRPRSFSGGFIREMSFPLDILDSSERFRILSIELITNFLWCPGIKSPLPALAIGTPSREKSVYPPLPLRKARPPR